MLPNVKIGSYGANSDSVGTGVVRSLALGFIPDYIEITNMVTGKRWAAFPSRGLVSNAILTNAFSNGTALRLNSNIGLVGATGNNPAYSANGLLGGAKSGSYVMCMGGINDARSPSTKQKGIYVGKKLNASANYNYIAYRSGAGLEGGSKG